jgi:hypothetical protein
MVHFYSIHYNKPKFIELQNKSFEKFAGEYTFTVIDNSIDVSICEEIKSICDSNNIGYMNTTNKFDSRTNGLHGFSHYVGIDLFLDRLKNYHDKNDIVVLFDHDIFLTSDFNKLNDLLSKNAILTAVQRREHVYYIWPGLVIFNLSKCVNIEELSLNGDTLVNGSWLSINDGVRVDIGGNSYQYLKKYENVVLFEDLMPYLSENNSEISENYIFYHFLAGSQWSNYAETIWYEKYNRIKNYIDSK